MPDEPITMPDSSAALTKDGKQPDHVYYGIFQRLVERFNLLRNQADDTETGLGSKAAKVGQTEAYDGLLLVAANQAYVLVLRSDRARTITEVAVKSSSGTCTATFDVDGVPLSGGASSVATTESAVAHDSPMAAGSTLTMTISANASALNVAFSIKYTYDLS